MPLVRAGSALPFLHHHTPGRPPPRAPAAGGWPSSQPLPLSTSQVWGDQRDALCEDQDLGKLGKIRTRTRRRLPRLLGQPPRLAKRRGSRLPTWDPTDWNLNPGSASEHLPPFLTCRTRTILFHPHCAVRLDESNAGEGVCHIPGNRSASLGGRGYWPQLTGVGSAVAAPWRLFQEVTDLSTGVQRGVNALQEKWPNEVTYNSISRNASPSPRGFPGGCQLG